MADQEIVTRTCIRELGNQIWRKEIELEANFWGKCDQCEREFRNKVVEATADKISDFKFNNEGFTCPNCETGNIRPPDHDQKLLSEGLMKLANENGESLREVGRAGEDDFQIADDIYIVLIKGYVITKRKSENGDPDVDELGHLLKEVYRADPSLMRVSASERQEIGSVHKTCLIHRQFITTADSPDACSHCGSHELYPVHYIETMDGGKTPSQAFIKGEVIHTQKYRKGRLYGYSPILTGWPYMLTLMSQINYVSDYYVYREIPSGLMVFPSNNREAVRDMWDDWREKVRDDNQYKPVFAYDPTTGDNKPEFIRFDSSLDEMQYMETRKEFADRIGGYYGVEPALRGDVSTSGGLNNESLQITVTNRVVESGQAIWNNFIFPKIMEAMNVTDWKYVLPLSLEEDQVAELEREAIKISNAQSMHDLGFDVELNDEGNFIFSGKAKEQIENGPQNQFFPPPPQQLTAPEQDQEEEQEEEIEKKKSQWLRKSTVNDILASDLYQRINVNLQDILRRELEALRDPNPEPEQLEEAFNRFLVEAKGITNTWVFRYLLAMFKYGKNTAFNQTSEQDLDTPDLTIDSILGGVSPEDTDAIDAFEAEQPFIESFTDFTRDISDDLREVVREGFQAGQKPSLDEIIGTMQGIIATDTFRIERIARSESQRFVLAGREVGYRNLEEEREEELLYVWRIRRDDRTSSQCIEMVRRVEAAKDGRQGITLDELKQIAHDVQSEFNGPKWRTPPVNSRQIWLIHPNCRSRFIRRV
ncbi:MAG: hypothetical protein V3U54_13070 [Thermodesulfobacteriota bacterium]